MRNRAAWRSRPDDPKRFLGWLIRDLSGPVGFVAERLAWVLRAAALAALIGGQWLLAMFLYAVSSLPVEAATLRNALPFRRRPFPIGSLLTLPPIATPFPCRIEVRKRGTLLGSDAGVATFVDGWLHFEGLRTSFSLRRADIDKRMDDRLALTEGGEVTFVPEDTLVAEETTEVELATRFRANLKSWMRSDSPAGEPILPPGTAHPTGLVRAKSNLTATIVIGAALVVWTTTHSAHIVVGVVALSFTIGLFQALCDLRRVQRSTSSLSPRRVVE